MSKSAEQKVNVLLESQGYVRVSRADAFYHRRRAVLRAMQERGEVHLSIVSPSYLTYSKVNK